jgi:hypothetical protein
MPSKKKPETADVEIPKELLDNVVKGPMTQAEVDAVCRSLKKAVIERAMNAELSDHLGYEPGAEKPEEQSNHRNGASGKTVITDEGPLRIEVPRDQGSFEPQLIGKHEGRFTGFDQKIIAIYARGMTVRRSRVTCWRCIFLSTCYREAIHWAASRIKKPADDNRKIRSANSPLANSRRFAMRGTVIARRTTYDSTHAKAMPVAP